MEAFWDKRYGEEGYAYGTDPNAFFAEALARYQPMGRILLPAEGEGRNAVHAAQQGLEVYAYDISKAGQQKALQLAATREVAIHYELAAAPAGQVAARTYDVAALIYAHFPAALRADHHRRIQELLKPGGLLILEAFSKAHLPYRRRNPQVGGPNEASMLLSVAELERDFNACEPLLLTEEEIQLGEGKYHRGTASVVRFIGRKHQE